MKQTYTLTKEELCKMISISPNCRWCRNPLIMKTTKRESHRFKTEVIDRIWLECTNEGCMRKGGAECILHLNDKIQTDECERCGNKLSAHINVTSSREGDNGDYCPKGFPLKDTEISPSNKFKSKLKKVVGLEMVERCEC